VKWGLGKMLSLVLKAVYIFLHFGTEALGRENRAFGGWRHVYREDLPAVLRDQFEALKGDDDWMLK
jgi:hypothetical protein